MSTSSRATRSASSDLDAGLAAADGDVPHGHVVGGDDDASAHDRAGLADDWLGVVEHERALMDAAARWTVGGSRHPRDAGHGREDERAQPRQCEPRASELAAVVRVREAEEREAGLREHLGEQPRAREEDEGRAERGGHIERHARAAITSTSSSTAERAPPTQPGW